MPTIDVDVATLADRLVAFTPGPDDAPMPPWWDLLQWILQHRPLPPWPGPNPGPDPGPDWTLLGRAPQRWAIAGVAHAAVQQAAAMHLAGAQGAAGIIRQLVDDYCGTPPRRPWPWPPHVPWHGQVDPADQFALGVALAQAARLVDGSEMADVALDAAAVAMKTGLAAR